jgi:hypothetical protein
MSYQLGSMESDQRAEFFPETRDHEARPRFRALLLTVAALLVMGLFAGGLWFAYMQGLRHGTISSGADVPLIRADDHPTKVKPEKPGGMEIPDRDKMIYTQKRAAVEHLLPPPEKPMPRPTASAVSPSQSDASPASAAPPAAPGAVAAASNSAVPAQMQQLGAKAPGKAPTALGAPAKPTSAEMPPTKPGATRIQLGSVRSEDAARQEWDRLKRTNADLLASLSATPIRADLGDKGVFYRIQTAPVADAERVCGELKRRNIGCIIAR